MLTDRMTNDENTDLLLGLGLTPSTDSNGAITLSSHIS